jgi:hypothetical protein
MANGGVAGRHGYATDGAVDDAKEVLRKKLLEGKTGFSPEDAAGVNQVLADQGGGPGVAPAGTRGVVVTPAVSPETPQPGLVPPTPLEPNIAPTENRVLVPRAAGTAELGTKIENYNQDDFYGSYIIPKESKGRHLDKYGNPLTSSDGAIGIAQMLPSTGPESAALAGVKWDENLFYTDPAYNEKLGRAYFNNLVDRYNGDTTLAAAAYNAGMGRVDKAVAQSRANGGNWTDYLPGETRNFISGMPSGMSEGLAAAASNSGSGSGGSGRSAEGGLLPADWQAGIDKFKQWGKDNESFIVPLLAGLGGMLSSASPTLAGSIGSGLVAGSSSFGEVLNAQQARELQAAEANAQMATLVRPDPNNPGFYIVYNPKTGQNALMDINQLRQLGLTPPPSGGLVPTAPATGTPPDGGLVPAVGAPAEVPAGVPANGAPEVPAAPEITTSPTTPTVTEERPPLPGVSPLPDNYNFKPNIIDKKSYDFPAVSVSISPESRALAATSVNHGSNTEVLKNLSDNHTQYVNARKDLSDLSQALGTIAGLGGVAAAGTAKEGRQAIMKLATTVNRMFGTDISTDIIDAAAAADVINKITALSGSNIAAARGQTAASTAEFLSSALPSMETEPAAARKMMAKMMIDAQRPIDQFDYFNKWKEISGSMLNGADIGFSRDMISVYNHDDIPLQNAMKPIQVEDLDGNMKTMTPIQALHDKIVTPAAFEEMFPGVIRYHSLG